MHHAELIVVQVDLESKEYSQAPKHDSWKVRLLIIGLGDSVKFYPLVNQFIDFFLVQNTFIQSLKLSPEYYSLLDDGILRFLLGLFFFVDVKINVVSVEEIDFHVINTLQSLANVNPFGLLPSLRKEVCGEHQNVVANTLQQKFGIVFIITGLSLAKSNDDDFGKNMLCVIKHEILHHINLQEDHENDFEHNHALNILHIEEFELAKHLVE
jgi:hypothetical protein